MKRKSKILIIVVLLLVALSIAGVIIFINMSKVDPKKYYETKMNELSTFLKKEVEKSKQSFSGQLGIKFKNKDISDLGLNINYSYDYERQKEFINYILTTKGKDLVDGNIYIANKKAYLNIKNVVDNYYFIDLEDNKEFLEQSMPQDFISMIQSGLNVLKKTLKDDNYSYVNENKEKKVILKITEDKYIDFVKQLIINLRADQEFVNNCSKVFDKKNSEIKEEITKLIDEDYKPKNIVVTTYLKDKDIDKINIDITGMDINYNMLINKTSNNSYSITLKEKIKEEEKVINGMLTVNNGNLIININYDDVVLNISNNIKYNETLKEPDITSAKDINILTEYDFENIFNTIFSNNQEIYDFLKPYINNNETGDQDEI